MKISPRDRLFLDTNVLLEATDEGRPYHSRARVILETWPRQGAQLYLSGQVLREYLVVATRPEAVNGLGLLPAEAVSNAREFRRVAVLCPESSAVSERLCALVSGSGSTGKRVHDLNIAATMLESGLQCLVTGNPDDFSALAGIVVWPLAQVEG